MKQTRIDQKTIRNERMISLHNKGWTFEKIGQKYGISKQRVHQLFNKDKNNDEENKFFDAKEK